MKRILSSTLVVLLSFVILSGCAPKLSSTTAKSSQQRTLDLYWQGVSNWSDWTTANFTLNDDPKSTAKKIITKIKAEHQKLEKYSPSPLRDRELSFNKNLSDALTYLGNDNLKSFSYYTDQATADADSLRNKIGNVKSKNNVIAEKKYKSASSFLNKKNKKLASNSSSQSSSYSADHSSASSNPDAYSGSSHADSSSSSNSVKSKSSGISDIGVQSTIESHYSSIKIKEVDGQYDKPITTGISVNEKDDPDYYVEGGYKKDAYHILLAIKDDYGFSDFQNITITFYMDGDALVKSSFNKSALKQINSKDSNYYNIDNVASEWNADNLHQKFNQ